MELLPGPLEVIAQEIRVHARHAGAGQTSELIVSALDAAGWAVVPKVPTEAMEAKRREWVASRNGWMQMVEAGRVKP